MRRVHLSLPVMALTVSGGGFYIYAVLAPTTSCQTLHGTLEACTRAVPIWALAAGSGLIAGAAALSAVTLVWQRWHPEPMP